LGEATAAANDAIGVGVVIDACRRRGGMHRRLANLLAVGIMRAVRAECRA
jgi:hypothetical protein